MDDELRPELQALQDRLALTGDELRSEARDKRHARGNRTARENLEHLTDADSFVEYGQLAVAAQRNRRDYVELQSATAADGILTGLCTINADRVSEAQARAAVIVNDYSVLAGTQGFFHHKPSKSGAVEQREDGDLSACCANVVSTTEGRRWSEKLYHFLVALLSVAESWLPTHVM